MPNNPFSQMFAPSPFKPMQTHMNKAHECAAELINFFEAVIQDDWTKAADAHQLIQQLEHDADTIKKDVRSHLPKSLFLPVPRTDLLELLRMQDKIANRAKDIAGIMIGRRMSIPAEISELMLQFVTSSVATSEKAKIALCELDELVASGFRGHEVDIVEEFIVELDKHEHQADQLERELRHRLFAFEKTLDPIDAMFLYHIVSGVGDLADRAQQVGSRLLLLVAR